jgi:U3 small nucleolar RNA-associated protein 12
MVKSYLRYEPSSTLGVIVSPNSNILCTSPTTPSSVARSQPILAIVPALESVKVWNVKTSILLATLTDPPSSAEVTFLARNPVRKNLIAAGYQDGSVRVWSLNETCSAGELVVTFNGHKSAITKLSFDSEGNRLASGSRDTDVVLWDLVSEEGLARLRSHEDQITGLVFLRPIDDTHQETPSVGDLLLTAGKDGLIKVWDLSTNFCIETHLAHRGETWALAASPSGDVVVTAGPDGELKFWSAKMTNSSDPDAKILSQRGTISRVYRDKPLSLNYHPSAGFLAVHSANRNIEVYRLRTADEIKRFLSRKRKRKSKKGGAADETESLQEEDIANEVIAYTTIRTSAKVRSLDWDTTVSTTTVQVASSYKLTND